MALTIGLGINSPPAQLVSTLNSTTLKLVVPELSDQVLIPSPFFWMAVRDGVKKTGGEVVYPLLTAEEQTGGAYFGDQPLQTQVVDTVQPANQLWRHYYQSTAIPFTDLIENSGPEGILKLAQTKWEIAASSFLQKLQRAIFHVSPQNTSLDIDDLGSWLYQTTNIIAGIDRSQAINSFWLPAGPVQTVNQGAITTTDVETLYQSCTYGNDEPNLLLMPLAMWRVFRQNFLSNIRYFDEYTDERAVQAGFRYHFRYNNCLCFQDRVCNSFVTGPVGIYASNSTLNTAAGQVAFMMNMDYIQPIFHENNFFTVLPWLITSGQDVLYSRVRLSWQLVNFGPRMSGVLANNAVGTTLFPAA